MCLLTGPAKMSPSRKKILFVHNAMQPFVATDYNLLSERWEVRNWYQQTRLVNPLAVVRAVASSDLVFCWFASWHSLLPVLLAKILHRPSIVVVGGYDTANLPEVGYGSQRGGIRRWVSRTVMRNAVHLIVNSRSAELETERNVGIARDRITVIYHGIAPLQMGPTNNREPIVLTVGGVWQENLLRKGLLPFVQSAQYLPDKQFVLVGKWHDKSIERLRASAGKNVTFTGFLPDEDLEALYMRSSVYVQASLHEGFGLSVAEAMSAGCIPVVTRAGALPEVVGDAGVYAESNSPLNLSTAITTALAINESVRFKAHERVLTLFSIEKRRQALHELVDRSLMTGCRS